MLDADFTPAFARDRKKCGKKHWDISALDKAIMAIMNSDTTEIPAHFNDHALSGNMQGYRELHIGSRKSDWLLIYKVEGNVAVFVRSGTHDELY